MTDNNKPHLTISERVAERISKMEAQVAAIRNAYGEDSRYYVKAASSLMHCLAQIARLGGEVFVSDDHLSLGGLTDYGLAYGVIWFAGDMVALRGLYGPNAPEVGEWSIHT